MEILINKKTIKEEGTNILSAKIQSRHIGRTKYKLLIAYLPNIKDVLSISAWKCTCKVGNRKVGCCSHKASLIFYLSCGKYEEKLKKPGYSLNSI
jgi:hypothetical protein